MHPNELVNVLLAARGDMERHLDRLERLLTPEARRRVAIDPADAAHLERLFKDVIRELDEAVTQRSLGAKPR